jgi:hypothetical protein
MQKRRAKLRGLAPQHKSRAEVPVTSYELLPVREQRRLAHCIVLTRSEELRLAYPDIKAITLGHRIKNKVRRGERVIDPDEPCVVFLVDRKLPTHDIDADRLLPARLMTMAMIEGRDTLVSVPTDVQELGFYKGAVPHGLPAQIAAFSGREGPEVGQICCAVRISQEPRTTFAIGCLHVFTPKAARDGGPQQEATLFLADGADGDDSDAEVGITTAVAGTILSGTSDGNFSFDAQLAAVEDEAALHAAIGDVVLTGSVEQAPDVPSTYFVQTSRGPIEVTQVRLAGPEVEIIYDRDITGAGGIPVHHAELLVSKFSEDSPLLPGDSGSPVTSQKNGGLLIGMHIAGDREKGLVYAIPAWRILNRSNYDGLPPERWVLVRSSDLKEPAFLGPGVGPAPKLANLQPPTVNTSSTASKRAFAVFAKAAGDALVSAGFTINATVCACQAILESGWGTSQLTREHNAFFGIKAPPNFTGDRARFPTNEFEDGGVVRVVDDFRSYPSWRESFLDYGKLIGKAPRYQKARDNVANALLCLQEIKAAGYATEPDYVTNVQKISAQFPNELGTI